MTTSTICFRHAYWQHCGRGGGEKDASILSVWRHSQYCI